MSPGGPRVRSTQAGPASASRAGRKGMGKGRGGMRTWKGKNKTKKKSDESGRAHTLEHTPAWERTIAGKSHLIGHNSYGVIRYF